jgi:4-alpha-glucanotransferase
VTDRPTSPTASPAGSPSSEAPSAQLVELARAYGVATEYWDWLGEHVTVSPSTIRAVLAALGVDASTDEAVAVALLEAVERPWRRMLPPVVVIRSGSTASLPVHVPHGAGVTVEVELESGGRRSLSQLDRWVEPRVVDGAQVGEAVFEIPAGLPLGWHTVHARSDDRSASAPLVVTPDRLELPEALREEGSRWGLMTQLYQVRSSRSWGVGDLDDLAELAVWSAADLGADFLLVNPLHAAEPVGEMEPSPYLPTTRRFVNPLYIRVEAVPEAGYLTADRRAELDELAAAAKDANTAPELDRDSSWRAKRAALRAVFDLPRSPGRERDFRRYCEEQGQGLVDFATWCALAEAHSLPWGAWPEELHDPRSEAVAAERDRLADEVEFYRWLQWVADEQLAEAQRRAEQAGMRLGIVHDLAVGVHPEGADAWGLGPALARGVTVGAPPDAFNQQGQDWSQPPWRPDQLAELGYAPYRDMLRTVLRHAGGIRVDHIIGLFRLWWVPQGKSPKDGTYVRYDHEAVVGILALEAQRSGAVVVGEDLGVVEPWVRKYLEERGVFGTSILWFERDAEGQPLPPESWRELCLATVTTHDLPPTAGYLAGVHVDLRDRLGLLTRSVEEERAADAAERDSVLALLRKRGLLNGEVSEQQVVEALHRFLTWTPSKLLGVSLADAVGDRRTINQPGTHQEYPNWRVALSDGSGRPLLLEDVVRSRRARSLARAVRRR